MPPRQLQVRPLRDGCSPTTPPTTPTTPSTRVASREPVLIGDILFGALAELAGRSTAEAPPAFPGQRTRAHP
ncbi:hypothetical protein ACF9IK_17115 [Kitasatospora hibisci]|uniref:hypothetical protein n=1 Tax=Kitasatospora hibisci TaxID=3369522 RepID=UPI003753F047